MDVAGTSDCNLVPLVIVHTIISSKLEYSTMQTGTVKWFNDAKGYGFISPDDNGADLFVHHTAIDMDGFRTLKEGQRVEFESTQGPKGMQASNVKMAEE